MNVNVKQMTGESTKMCFLNTDFEHQNHQCYPSASIWDTLNKTSALSFLPQPKDVTRTPWRHLQLHRDRCHSLSPPLTSNIGCSQQPLDNWSSSWRSPQREKGKTDTTQRTFNLYEPTETEPGEGRDKTARWTVGDRGSTDELGGVGKWGGLVCLTPFNMLRRKAGQNPYAGQGLLW